MIPPVYRWACAHTIPPAVPGDESTVAIELLLDDSRVCVRAEVPESRASEFQTGLLCAMLEVARAFPQDPDAAWFADAVGALPPEVQDMLPTLPDAFGILPGHTLATSIVVVGQSDVIGGKGISLHLGWSDALAHLGQFGR